MAWLKHNYKYRNIDKKSSTSDMSARVLRESMPRILKQAAEEEERAFKTRKLMDQVIVGGPSIIGQDEVYVCIDYAKQKPKQNQDNHEINPEEEMQ